MCLDAGGSRQRVETLFLEKRRALDVEHVVVTIDVAQVAAGAHNVVPGRALTRKQPGNVVESAPQLRGEVPDMDADSVFVDRGGTGDKQNATSPDIHPHAAPKITRLLVCVG